MHKSSTICSTLEPLTQSWRESVAVLESAKNTYQSEATDEAWDTFQLALQVCEKAQEAFVEKANEKITYLDQQLKVSHALIVQFFETQGVDMLYKFTPNRDGSLGSFDLSNTSVHTLPSILPQSIFHLILDKTNLTALPPHLPEALEHLNICHTGISQLPQNLPQNLEHLHLFDTHVRDLPEILPPTLRYLNAVNTPFARRADAVEIVEAWRAKNPRLRMKIWSQRDWS